MTENEISKIVVDIAYKVHTKIGPGLLESVYEEIIFCDLNYYGFLVVGVIGIGVFFG